MASCENKYTTLLDLSRQAKVITGETACFDGKIEVGIPFSGYPTGVDTNTIVSLGVVSSETAVFSGNTGTTVFDVSNTGSTNYNTLFSGYSGTVWTNSLFSGNTSGLTLPITPISADTQVVGENVIIPTPSPPFTALTTGPVWTLTQTGTTSNGEHIIGLQYTGYTITYSFSQIEQLSVTAYTAYSGFSSASQENFSAGTLDYKGPFDYISTKEDATVDGILTTKKLTVTDGASASTIGYVLTQIDEYGRAGWVYNSPSSGSTFTGNTSGTCISDIHVTNLHSCSPLNINPLDEGNVYFGSTSGVTIDIDSGGNFYNKGSINVQSDSIDPTTLLSSSEKGGLIYFSHTGRTSSTIANPNTSGFTTLRVGGEIGALENIKLNYYGSDYVRESTPVTGVNFYQNKGVLNIGTSTDGMVIGISPTGNTGNLWFEQNGNSIMYLKGGPSASDGKLGIGLNPDGTETPTERLHIAGGNIRIQNGSEEIKSEMNPNGPILRISADTDSYAAYAVSSTTAGGDGGISVGIRGATEPSLPGYGKQGDSFVYSSVYNNGLNIISQPTVGPQVTDDYIRFYAGQDADGTTPDLYIQGSGATRGNIGMGTETPTEKLHINNGNILVSYNQDTNTKLSIKNDNGTNDAKSVLNFFVSGSSLPGSAVGSIQVIGPDSVPTGTFMGSYLPNSMNITTSNLTTANRMHINIGSRRGSDAQTRFFGGSDDFDSSSLLGIFYTSGLTITDMVNTDTLRVRSGASSGYVLTSDADGVCSWGPKSLTNRRVRFVDATIDPNTNDGGGSDIIFYSGGTGGGTITLGTGNDAGNEIILMRFGDTVAVTLAGASSTVNGSGTKPLPTALYSTVRCIFDGTDWYCTNETLL